MIIASNNEGKIKEFKEILKIDNLYSLKDKNIHVSVIEDGKTFLENAKKKAKEIYDVAKEEVIADDSGLCVECLDGFPGIMTNRFLSDSSDLEKNQYLINEVNKHNSRNAEFVCFVVLYDGIQYIYGEGRLKGNISRFPRGKNGFGFDPIFELDDGKTLAELDSDQKNKISARVLALNDLKKKNKVE